MADRTLFEQANYVYESLLSLGVKLNPSSRIAVMRNALCFPDGAPRPPILYDDPSFNVVKEGIRDIQVLEFIFDTLPNLDALIGKGKLRRLIKDNIFPQEDKKTSFGRNFQFELFVASVCAIANLNPRLEEPDVVFDIKGQRFSFAVKRIQNIDRLEQRIDEGACQIEKAGIPGLIALDVSRAMNHDNVSIDHPASDYELALAAKKMIAEFERRHYSTIRDASRGKEVRGVIVHDSHIVRSIDGGYDLRTFQFPISCSKQNQRREREFGLIYNTYSKALPGTMSI